MATKKYSKSQIQQKADKVQAAEDAFETAKNNLKECRAKKEEEAANPNNNAIRLQTLSAQIKVTGVNIMGSKSKLSRSSTMTLRMK
jgi:hypothetical protein